MKSKEWVEAAVVFYDYWFSVSDEVCEKLVPRAKELEIFSKNFGALSEEDAREYKRIIVSRVKAQCQSPDDFLDIGDIFLSSLLTMLINGDSYTKEKVVETEVAVEELLKQGFDPTQVIEVITRGEGCASEKVAKILVKLSNSGEPHHCSGHCGHCGHKEPHGKQHEEPPHGTPISSRDKLLKPDLLQEVMDAPQKEQTDVLIALLKKKGFPVSTMVVLTGLSEEQIKSSKGFSFS